MMQMIFDSHAHYDNERFDGDREELLASLVENGVCAVINVGCDMESSRKSVRLAESFPHIYAAVGVHPHDAKNWTDDMSGEIAGLLSGEKVVALGEIGLDFHYDTSPRDAQLEVFEKQLALAKQLDVPIIIHNREAHAYTLPLIRKYAPLKGVFHCYSGSAELMKEVLKLGFYIGIGGSLTFKRAVKPVRVAAEVPADRFLLETDCPYLTPEPYRHKRNDSTYIRVVAGKMAEIRGETPDEIIRQARGNTCRLFGIDLREQ